MFGGPRMQWPFSEGNWQSSQNELTANVRHQGGKNVVPRKYKLRCA